MNTFDYANEALRRDLSAYAEALHTLVTTLPQARHLCDMVVKEMRLATALLAFANQQATQDLTQILYQLGNLWPFREQAYARTLGFTAEISEARTLRAEASRGLRILARQKNDPLAVEVSTCFDRITHYLEEEEKLLEECDRSIRPHAENMDLTRKRLNLLIAAIDARIPPTPEQQATLNAYTEAANILKNWESGVPLDERGVAILEECLAMLEQANLVFGGFLYPATHEQT
ncbi:MAG TPA: hypothetical protein PKA05_17500 [Roseiflexaceae bacterium]|nr:hypothetical protein [Roseiflexaceae bacterium]HMP42178.1 hypothetical protein [Roseiflexaceae bacterium]